MFKEISTTIIKNYGFLPSKITRLNGYENENYLVEYEGAQYIFKTYPFEQQLHDVLLAENEILSYLHTADKSKYPQPIPNLEKCFLLKTTINEEAKTIRMLSFLKGKCYGDVENTTKLMQSFGHFLATMDKALSKVNNYTIKARVFNWDIAHLQLNRPYIQEIDEASDQKLVEYFFLQFKEQVKPILPHLRKSIIHSDANEWNVLVNQNQVSGIIDFGDLVYSPLINELAIAIAYVLLYSHEKDLEFIVPLIESYHQVLPLEEQEVDILYYLIAARLCTSLTNSAYAQKLSPENTYISISAKPAWKTLHYWLSLNPIAAKNTFRKAIGLKVEKIQAVEKAVTKRHQAISPLLSISYKKPIYTNRAAFQYMYDVYGNTYLDAYNNIPHVGHSHPRVVEAAQRQIAKLNTNTRYIYDELEEYASKLLATFPSNFTKVYFVNSGSAASDLAIRMAHNYNGFENLMVMEYGYHGHTQNGIDISDYKFNNKVGQGQKTHIIKANIPDTYRGKYNNNDGTAGVKYAQEAIIKINNASKPIAAFISEPIVGCGGQIPLAKGYLKKLYPAIRKQGGLCISDEVQTGFGRLGDVFWGFEQHEVLPDIIILGKPMGNGHPIGAVVTTNEVADSFAKGVEFFSSFGGNPVSCATGLAVLNVIKEEQLQENAKMVGNHYLHLFKELQKDFSCIGDVRGSGLFLGVEIVKNQENRVQNLQLAALIKNELRNRHILISTDGPFDSVLKTKPPLCFTKKNAEQVVVEIRNILGSGMV